MSQDDPKDDSDRRSRQTAHVGVRQEAKVFVLWRWSQRGKVRWGGGDASVGSLQTHTHIAASAHEARRAFADQGRVNDQGCRRCGAQRVDYNDDLFGTAHAAV